ncbi:unnamed protein product [Larinioides sclopetarius]|uniref:Uncharacterized protein n=1 Tax=Larinioides sclopetarius TaxID=280406 RepID=A0AAV2BMH3_9ARAC
MKNLILVIYVTSSFLRKLI